MKKPSRGALKIIAIYTLVYGLTKANMEYDLLHNKGNVVKSDRADYSDDIAIEILKDIKSFIDNIANQLDEKDKKATHKYVNTLKNMLFKLEEYDKLNLDLLSYYLLFYVDLIKKFDYVPITKHNIKIIIDTFDIEWREKARHQKIAREFLVLYSSIVGLKFDYSIEKIKVQ